MTAVRTTGVQAAQVAIAACIERWRDQLSPREYVVLIDLLAGYLEKERLRTEAAARRWGIS